MTPQEFCPELFDDPDKVGQSEYRAIYEVLEGLLEGTEEGHERENVMACLSEFADTAHLMLGHLEQLERDEWPTWRVVWQARPYVEHPIRVLFVKAEDSVTARTFARCQIEKKHGISWFNIHLCNPWTEPAGEVVNE